MVGIDTNVLLRLLLDDDAAQSAHIDAWLAALPTTAGQVHIADVVLAETVWTLSSAYKQPKTAVLTALQALHDEPMFSFEDRAAVAAATATFAVAACGFSDCLIVARNLAAGCQATATFDKAMQALPGALPV